MRRRGLVVAGGQGKLAGRILRFGHMGMVQADELADAARVMGETLADAGHAVDPAAAAEAALAAAGR
jgi:aspartate aminotransferase-like enzyme